MTCPYSNSFRLIKAYKKHSNLYKNCTNENQKIKLFKTWFREVMDKEIIIESQPFKNSIVFCQMCLSTTIANECLCCDKCLFPILDTLENHREPTARQQLFTFVLLSICFWNEVCNKKNNFYNVNENIKLIWKQRIKMAWEDAHRPFICFFTKSINCLQCNMKCIYMLKRYNINKDLRKKFDINYFCKNCLFPLFDILYFI